MAAIGSAAATESVRATRILRPAFSISISLKPVSLRSSARLRMNCCSPVGFWASSFAVMRGRSFLFGVFDARALCLPTTALRQNIRHRLEGEFVAQGAQTANHTLGDK